MELYKVGRKIKEERIRKKISQEELCGSTENLIFYASEEEIEKHNLNL